MSFGGTGTGTSTMSRKSTTAAQGISSLFDNGWQTQTSAIRNKASMTRTYDPKTSWGGLTQGNFSRSDIKGDVAFQSSGPIGLVGGVVLPLADSKSLEILNVRQPPKQLCEIPLTNYQAEMNMSSDLRGRVPS